MAIEADDVDESPSQVLDETREVVPNLIEFTEKPGENQKICSVCGNYANYYNSPMDCYICETEYALWLLLDDDLCQDLVIADVEAGYKIRAFRAMIAILDEFTNEHTKAWRDVILHG